MPKQNKLDKFSQQLKDFEKNNPAVAEAMKILDMSLKEYGQALRSLEPSKTYTTNSTSVLQKT